MAGSIIFRLSQRRAFKQLLANSRQRLYRMAYAWTHDPYLADDLVQQTMCKALSKQRQLKDIATADAWLFRILANCLADYRRARREVSLDENFELVDNRTPEHQTQEQQLVTKVRHAISMLSLAQRQVVTLVDLEGFTYATVAETLDMPVGTVMSRLCRGRKALRELLADAKSDLPTERTETVTRIRRFKDING